MTDKKDDASKTNPGAGGGTSGGGQASQKPVDAAKRPHAIVEGTAIEITSKEVRPEGQKPEAAKSPEASKNDSLKSGGSTTSGASNQKSPDPAAASKNGTKSTADKSQPGKPDANNPSSSRRSSGIGSAFTHLLAGAIGGATAWYGVTAIGPEFGIAPPAVNLAATKVLEEKVAALERFASTSKPSAPDLTGKLAAAEAEIAKLQAATKAFGEINAAQGKLATDVRALSEAQLKQAEGEGRIAKLEERLKLLSDAAGDKDAGKLPQLAAVTGRLVDLEATLTNQLSALRKTVSQELENRLAMTNETSEAARSGTNRVDRELSAVKAENATIAQRLDTVKTESERLAQKLATVAQDTSALKTAAEALRADLDSKFKASAKPVDVASAIAPVAGKLDALEQNLQSVVKSEEDRRTNAERIVLSLELNNLKRVIDRGQKYGAELAEVRRIAGGKVDLAVLERHKDSGLPTLADLTREFQSVANVMLDSEAEPAEGTVIERMLANAKSVVRVRKVNHAANDKSLEAVIGRMETALKDGRVADVATESRNLPSKAASAAQPFLLKLEARAAVDAAIAMLETSLKSSLAGKPTN